MGKVSYSCNCRILYLIYTILFFGVYFIFVFIGGTFALYSLLFRHAKFSLLPNQQAADEELSAYKYGPSAPVTINSPLKRFLDKHKKLRIALLVFVLIGAGMVIGDGVLTPAISGAWKILFRCY